MSNLSFVSKLMEKVVSIQLHRHLIMNKLIEKFQSAYRPSHSTETTLLRVMNDLLIAVDGGNGAILLLLDLSDAFDTIDHKSLLSLMNDQLGIDGIARQWFASYLKDRKQLACIGDCLSSSVGLKYGVPQGSILGPMLFSLYLIPLGHIIKKHNVNLHIYADDTQLYCMFDPKSQLSITSVILQLQSCIIDIQQWMAASKLKLNDDKSELLLISSPSSRNLLKDISLQMGNHRINQSVTCRNLGVMFDSCLTMKVHVSTVCRHACFQLRNIGSIRKYLTDKACAQLIHSFVTSRLDYCNSLLAHLPKCTIQKLQRIQNIAARILSLKKKYDHITPILVELHWLPVRLRIVFKIILIVFECLKIGQPEYLSDIITPYKQV